MPDRLSLHDLHAAAGATFVGAGGVARPLHYGDAAAEYAAVRQTAGLIDRGDAGVLEVTGRDRAAFLHAMLSNDIKSLGAGQGCAAAFLDVHGKVQALLWVWALEDRILLLTPPGLAEKTLQALDKYLFAEKASFRDATGDLTLLMLAGPDAAAVAHRLTGRPIPTEAWSHVATKLAGVDVRLVTGGGETGGPEVWIVAPTTAGPELWRAVVAAGVRAVGLSAREALRIEAGTADYDRDVDTTVLLPEIPTRHLVSHTKGCYIGQEVVVRIRDRGHVNRQLAGLLLEGDAVPSPGDSIVAAESDIGRVTSATWSFGLKRPISLGFVRRHQAQPGTPVTVRSAGRTLPATVSALPFAR